MGTDWHVFGHKRVTVKWTNELWQLGQRLLEAVRQGPHKQSVVAMFCELSNDKLAEYVEGRECPDALLAVRFAKVCGVSIVWLLTGKGKMTPYENTPGDPPAMSFEDEIEKFGI